MAYDARRSTRDIDAIFKPHGVVHEEAQHVAKELGFPSWWLNEQASMFVASGQDSDAPKVFDHPNLRVAAASAEHLLAMKVLAARRRDADDIRLLTEHLELHTIEDVKTVCFAIFPEEPLPDRAQLVLEDVFEQSD